MPSGIDTGGRADDGPGGDDRGTLSRWFLKPPDGGTARPAPRARSSDQLEHERRSADDKERMVGLIGAPVAAGIAFVVVRHASGTVTSKSELLALALVLALAMLVLAWFGKRTPVGIAMALYGLSVFGLGFWGFGVPYVAGAAWLLVRAHRTRRELSEAVGTSPARSPGPGAGRPPHRPSRARRRPSRARR